MHHTGVMSFAVRDATETDHQVLDGVYRRASLSNENDRAQLLRHPEWLVLSEDGIREGRMSVAIDEEETVVGFATFLIKGDVVELEDLFVEPTHMRRGVGELLVREISRRVRERGFDTLEVTANPHALPFYEYMGFVAHDVVDTELYPAPRMRRPT
jgi:GNAT superfamily N-acetyltransferase